MFRQGHECCCKRIVQILVSLPERTILNVCGIGICVILIGVVETFVEQVGGYNSAGVGGAPDLIVVYGLGKSN